MHPAADSRDPCWPRRGRALLSGFNNPLLYAFDGEQVEGSGRLEVKYALPYSDLDALDPGEIEYRRNRGLPVEFSHILQTLIGGQIEADLVLTGFHEDHDEPGANIVMNRYFSPYLATRSVKPDG